MSKSQLSKLVSLVFFAIFIGLFGCDDRKNTEISKEVFKIAREEFSLDEAMLYLKTQNLTQAKALMEAFGTYKKPVVNHQKPFIEVATLSKYINGYGLSIVGTAWDEEVVFVNISRIPEDISFDRLLEYALDTMPIDENHSEIGKLYLMGESDMWEGIRIRILMRDQSSILQGMKVRFITLQFLKITNE